jgi:hypothetical protein
MDIFDVLEYGWILADDRNGFLVTWNGMSTYNLWAHNGETWKNIDVRTYDPTNGSTPVSMGNAAVYASDFLLDALHGGE